MRGVVARAAGILWPGWVFGVSRITTEHPPCCCWLWGQGDEVWGLGVPQKWGRGAGAVRVSTNG